MTTKNNITAPAIAPLKHKFLLKSIMVFVGISGCFSVLFGAWLAHAGQALPLSSQESLATALKYQFFHTLALWALLIWLRANGLSKTAIASGLAFIIGILCFSGSIYLKSLFGIESFAKLSPFGGITLALAWLLLAFESKNIFN
jgi:uncharacterized membrane protein YgdD (TMEM256/DUF423 family)